MDLERKHAKKCKAKLANHQTKQAQAGMSYVSQVPDTAYCSAFLSLWISRQHIHSGDN